MTTSASALVPDDFSVHKAGPVYRAAQRLGLCPRGQAARLGLILAAVTWLPLLVLVLIEGSFGKGSDIPFRDSVSTHARFLVSLPLFFLAADFFDARVPQVLQRLVLNGVVRQADLSTFARGLVRVVRARDSAIGEVVVLGLVATALVAGVRADQFPGIGTWRTSPTGSATMAGLWYSVVSIPIFQFVFWRSCYRLLLWGLLLWQVSRLDLQLIPTHPDGAAGLSMLGVAHVDLAPVATASLTILASSYAEQMLYGGVKPMALAVPLTAAVVGTVLVLIGPLFLFVPKLLNAKQQAVLEYGTLASQYSREFADKWIAGNRKADEHLVGSADIQSLADMGSSFNLIRSMSLLPIAPHQILWLGLASVLPVIPLVLIIFPLDQLIIDTLRSILNV